MLNYSLFTNTTELGDRVRIDVLSYPQNWGSYGKNSDNQSYFSVETILVGGSSFNTLGTETNVNLKVTSVDGLITYSDTSRDWKDYNGTIQKNYSGGGDIAHGGAGYSDYIEHDLLGNKSVIITVTGKIRGYDVSLTFTHEFESIDRVGGVSCSTNVYVGDTSIITVVQKDSATTHKLRYKLYSLTGEIPCKGTGNETVHWVIPDEFLTKFNAGDTFISGTVYCDFYDGETLIGSDDAAFKVHLDINKIVPTMNPSFRGINTSWVDSFGIEFGEASADQYFLQYVSDIAVIVNAEAVAPAEIESVEIEASCREMDTNPPAVWLDNRYQAVDAILYGIDSPLVTITVTDTRGTVLKYTYNLYDVYEGHSSYHTFTKLSANLFPNYFSTEGDFQVRLEGLFSRQAYYAANSLDIQLRISTTDGEYDSGLFRPYTPTEWYNWIADNALAYYNGTGEAAVMNLGNGTYNLKLGQVQSAPTDAEHSCTYEFDYVFTGLDYSKEYVIEARVADKVTTINTGQQPVISRPVFDWGKTDFNFNVPVTVQDHLMLTEDKGIMGKDKEGGVATALTPLDSTGNTVLGFGVFQREKGDTKIYGNNVDVITNGDFTVNGVSLIGGSSQGCSIQKILTAFSTPHNFNVTIVTKGTNYSSASCALTLMGGTLFCRVYGSRTDISGVGDIIDELICRVGFNHGGKITGMEAVSGASYSGGMATLVMKNVEVTATSAGFDVELCNTDTGSRSFMAAFAIPVTIDLSMFEDATV